MAEITHQLASTTDFIHTSCSHESNCTVTWPTDSGAVIICEACYKARFHLLLAARLAANPPVPGLDCGFGCQNRAEVRYYEDMGFGICSECMKLNEAALARAEANHVLRDDILPDEVANGVLWIGPKEAAYNLTGLTSLGIKRILVCCDSLPLYHASNPALRYHRLPLMDSLSQDLVTFLPSALAFIAQGALLGERTLVHCNAGVSRSGSIAVEWLRRTLPSTLETALLTAKAKRPIITPNRHFLAQIKRLEESPGPI